ncbi:hypothetical protein M5689_000836 [Euphorbia peplus]|nr:hypothetical protein M5689_000836 [Euphorbia peplus]
MPSEAVEKTAQEIEDELMAVKLNVVIQQVELNKKADVDMNTKADVDMNKRADVDMNKRAETAELEGVALAKANGDVGPVSEDVEEDVPLSRKRTYKTKSSAAMRKPMRRSDYEIHLDPILEDETAEAGEAVLGKIVSDEEDTHMDDDEEHFNDDGTPIIETVSDDSSPEREDSETVLDGARVFAQNVDNEHFIDDVLLGQGRSDERRRNAYEVIDKMSHLFATPFASFDPNDAEKSQLSAPEDIPSSAPEQVIQSPEHNSPPPLPHTSASPSVT